LTEKVLEIRVGLMPLLENTEEELRKEIPLRLGEEAL